MEQTERRDVSRIVARRVKRARTHKLKKHRMRSRCFFLPQVLITDQLFSVKTFVLFQVIASEIAVVPLKLKLIICTWPSRNTN
jgi:hypothetical protein